ncbi:DUF523 and DUF1722 domain-containing protein [Pseudothermotoga sp.]|uniref:YbgA family protein n=1 Tax=Pseudothermotoga sp. TaxID=2033661 RepID=UPI0031F6E272
MREIFARPKVVFSACLNFEPVRYNGQMVKDEFCEKLSKCVEVVKVCPEVGAGLGVPRPAIKIFFQNSEKRVIQVNTGQDVTDSIKKFSESFLDRIEGIDGFVLKKKSPSCAISDAVAYKTSRGEKTVLKTIGIFTELATEKFPNSAFTDEGRLKNYWIREHFLTRIFSSADLKSRSFNKPELVQFHESYKYLLMAHSPSLLRQLGKLVSNLKVAPMKEIVSLYSELFNKAFSVKPTLGKHYNVLQHLYSHLKEKLGEKERENMSRLLEEFSRGKISLKTIREIFRVYALNFEDNYLLNQKYLNPYPRELESEK